ncbi:recombinase family protein [Cryobacterium breve]|uniref:recombinase family protein n=1 Tax=Cryobacterium breve TaxID=1259258 RepID=UPI0032B303C1
MRHPQEHSGEADRLARVSTFQQSTGRQEADIRAAGVRRDVLFINRGVSGTRASRPDFDRALDALEDGDTHDRFRRGGPRPRRRTPGFEPGQRRRRHGDARTAAPFVCSWGRHTRRAPRVHSGLHPFLPVAQPSTSRTLPLHGPSTTPWSQSPSALKPVTF